MYRNKRLSDINKLIDDKVLLITDFIDANNKKGSSIWLIEWNITEKQEKLVEIDSTELTRKELDKLNIYIERYFKFIDFLDKKEESDEDRYEEMLKVIIQIPSEILGYMKANIIGKCEDASQI